MYTFLLFCTLYVTTLYVTLYIILYIFLFHTFYRVLKKISILEIERQKERGGKTVVVKMSKK